MAKQDGTDDLIAAVVLSAPNLLSGLDQLEHENIRHTWACSRMPDQVARLSQLEKSVEHLSRGGRLTLQVASKCYSSQIVEAATKAHAAMNAAAMSATAS